MAANISKILQARLKGQNLSKVSRELGISKSLLADWVSARRLPSLKNIDSVAKVAAYLGLTLEQLLLGKEMESKTLTALTFEDDRSATVHAQVKMVKFKKQENP